MVALLNLRLKAKDVLEVAFLVNVLGLSVCLLVLRLVRQVLGSSLDGDSSRFFIARGFVNVGVALGFFISHVSKTDRASFVLWWADAAGG